MPLTNRNDDFDRLADEVFGACLSLNPIEATRLGIHGENDGQLPDRSPEGCAREVAVLEDLLSRFGAFRERDLTIDRAVDLRLARGGLTGRLLRMHKLPATRMSPASYIDDIVGGAYSLMFRDFAPVGERARALLERLNESPKLLAHARVNLKNPPAIFTETAAMEARGAIRFFDTGLKGFIGSVADPKLKSRLAKATLEVLSALESYQVWLDSELIRVSTGDFALGRHVYERLLAEEFALDWTADDLIAIGQQVYQETMREMKRVAGRIDKERPWSKVVDRLKAIHPEERDLIASYTAEMKRARDLVRRAGLAGAFPPGEAIEIVATPPFARPIFPYAGYIPPAPFEKEQKGTFWITTIDSGLPDGRREMLLGGHARHGIWITALHDAYPGHHLQLVRANQIKDHKLRFLFASPIFSEGWALYCEGMMHRCGLIKDDRVRVLQLKNLLWRACRVIIDVELQTGRMGFNDAATFLVRKARLERPNAVAEVRRYCANPTQPMSYVAGKVLIEELVEDAKVARGASFDAGIFHDELLAHGTIPVELIRAEMGIPRRSASPARSVRHARGAPVLS